jgi:demethylmenaquinone methyltransferase/2-methoxy-6-polyprenyl-1,4-benzoquinol methylase
MVRRLYRSYSFLSPRLAAAVGSDPEAYRYLPRSIEAFHEPEALATLLRDAGFIHARFERLTFGIAAIHVGEA